MVMVNIQIFPDDENCMNDLYIDGVLFVKLDHTSGVNMIKFLEIAEMHGREEETKQTPKSLDEK